MKWVTAKRQAGQSMTEFVVSAAFALVPLFLIVPVVGKYIDMKLSTVQAARYTTWEYTANYVDLSDQPAGFTAVNRSRMPVKTLGQVQNEAVRRFYSDTSIPIRTRADSGGYKKRDRNPFWTYHNRLAMYDPQQTEGVRASGSRPTPDKSKVFSGVVGILGTGLNFVADVFGSLGIKGGFDAINPDGNLTVDGRYGARLRMPVEEAPDYAALDAGKRKPLFGRDLRLAMKAKSGLLTETWGAGGRRHAVYQSSGLVPTVLIGYAMNEAGIPLQTLASTVLITPEFNPRNLRFGYPIDNARVMDEVPVGALQNDTRTLDCSGGYCEQ